MRTSSATTAKPSPASPARAASTVQEPKLFAEAQAAGINVSAFVDIPTQNLWIELSRIITPGTDALTLATELWKLPSELFGGRQFLLAIDQEIPSSANWPTYANELKQARTRRFIAEVCDRANALAGEPGADPAAIADDLASYLGHLKTNLKPVLPRIVSLEDMASDAGLVAPEEVVCGVLHRGSKMVIGAASKSRKSWLLDDLAICMATGRKFLKWPTREARVLLIDMELRPYWVKDRLQQVLSAKGMSAADLNGNLLVRALRGHARPLKDILAEILKAIQENKITVLILDPAYRLYTGDENSAQDMNAFCLDLERLASEVGVAVITTAHFAKGNSSGKNVIDRISGSGVVARDADSLIMLTAHQAENCVSVEIRQ